MIGNLIINTGGTFNKKYNELTGELDIMTNNDNIFDILENCYKSNFNGQVVPAMYVDSLDMTKNHRKIIKDVIETSKHNENIVIVHGTDTMDKTAKFLNKYLDKDLIGNTLIVLTGAMTPYSIDKQEATSNFISAMTFADCSDETGIFIAMHGLVKPFKSIEKDRDVGIFKAKD